jgi:hypothetical protein
VEDKQASGQRLDHAVCEAYSLSGPSALIGAPNLSEPEAAIS